MDYNNDFPEKVVISKGQAGLGNRMMSLLTCMLYAKLSGRQLVVDWRDPAYSDGEKNIFPYLFNNPHILPIESVDLGGDVYPEVWVGELDLSVLHLIWKKIKRKLNFLDKYFLYKFFSVDLNDIDRPEENVVFTSYTHKVPKIRKSLNRILPEYAALSDEDIIVKMIREELKPSDQVKRQIDLFVKEYFHGPILGVHIRMFEEKYKKIDIRKFELAIDRIIARDEDVKIFLCCINEEVQELFFKKYKKNIISTEKWLARKGERTHYNHNDEKHKITEITAIEALVDMFLLAKCDYLIYPGRSTFSYISHLMSGLTEDKVIDVNKRDFVWKINDFIHTHA